MSNVTCSRLTALIYIIIIIIMFYFKQTSIKYKNIKYTYINNNSTKKK